jgi:aconitate hydratase
MGASLTGQLIGSHLIEGGDRPGDEITIRVDQVLLQDSLGPMALLQFEAMGLRRVRPRVVVQYADHQTLQLDFRHADDHRFIASACRKFGVHYSKPGNGICHLVHLEQFAIPGESLLGADSHTPHCGAAGMLAIGAGGMDVAVAMGNGTYTFPRPRIVQVDVRGALRPWSTAKDVILEMLRRLTVRGGVGRIFEYGGPGMETLSVPERMTIANMGTELGHTASIFPSDAVTRDYFERLGRPQDWREAQPDPDAAYDERVTLDLDEIEPLIALPGSPDKVVPVHEVEGTKIQQVMVGSCTNGSFSDIVQVARLMKGRRVHPDVDFILFPGSRQIFELLARDGYVADLLEAGVVVSEATCGSCPGYGHVPASGTRSLRAFNRNFRGRSGLTDDQVYLASPEVATASAIRGGITDPRSFGEAPRITLPRRFAGDRKEIVPPAPPAEAPAVQLIKGPNIREVPIGKPFSRDLEGEVLIVLGDNVSTDDITPSGVEAITFRTNVPALADLVFTRIDPGFARRAKERGGGIIVGGQTYGQGSSREHAAIAPMHLGVRAVIAKSFARIHRANLVNWGILPLNFVSPADHDTLRLGQTLRIRGLLAGLEQDEPLTVLNQTAGSSFRVTCRLTPPERRIVLAGGVLAFTRGRAAG